MLTQNDIDPIVKLALDEDIGSGDITAGLVEQRTRICDGDHPRSGVLCGTQFVDAVFASVDPDVKVIWQKSDGDALAPNDVLFTPRGNARSILTGERAALNFLQMLSGTASYSASLASLVEGTKTKLLDTRKPFPAFETLRNTRLPAVAVLTIGLGYSMHS